MATPYELDLEKGKAEVAQSEERARTADEFLKFFTKHRNIKALDANRSILRAYFGDKPQDISVATLEIAISNPDVMKSLTVYASNDDLRDQLVEKIRSLLVGSPQSIEHRISQLRYSETDALRSKVEELERRQVARAKSPEELHAELQAVTTTIPELPHEYTKKAIIAMAPAALRKLSQVYSLAKVNARLAGRG